MTVIPWVDAAYTPTLPEAQQAYSEGFRACGFYLPGIPNSDPLNVWTPAQVQVLRQAGLLPVPIVVPDPHLSGDPVTTANAAFQQAKNFALNPQASILYDGPHLVNTGRITGPVWLPLPGNPPSTIGAGSAVQWGQGSISGWSVDDNEAAPDFPFDRGIVCDFEHAILNYCTADQAITWYQRFQARIAQLAGSQPQPPTISTSPVADPEVDNMQKHLINLTLGPDGVGWTPTPIPYPFASVVDVACNTANRALGQPPTPGTAKAAAWGSGTYVEVEGGIPGATYGVWVTVAGN